MPEMIADNLKSITERIAKCCERAGRPPDSVKLVAVTKEASIGQMNEAMTAGASSFGENRVQDALIKHRTIGSKAEWHLIGHLQTNKVKDAVSIFSLIHSVDSLKLAQTIDKEAAKLGKRQSILIQVNTSGEASKFGISPEATIDFLKEISLYPNISVEGLMTIAPEAGDPETVRPYFKALRELLNKTGSIIKGCPDGAGYSTLSMGMTNDFEIAIEEGSTTVRVGRAIFKNDK
jgi:pyridoxal phosphate enzyme (YggS family)